MFRSLASSSAGNLHIVDDGVSRILLECGLPFQKLSEAVDFQVMDFAGCLITHEHKDHCKAAPELVKRGLPVWCGKDTANACGIATAASCIVPGAQFKVGTFNVMPFEAVHDVPCLGYLILSNVTGEKLLFATDTQYMPSRAPGLTEIAVECNHSRELLMASDIPESEKIRIMQTHMSIETFIGFIQANDMSKVKTIHLLHMSNERGDAEKFKRMVQQETGCRVIVA